MLYEIKHRLTGAVLFSLECGSLKLCVEAAVSARVNLADADLAGANLADANLTRTYLARAYLARANLTRACLAGADLAGADLAGANLIDGGQDRRGFRFWAWRNKDGATVYRAGCHEWTDFADALAWYGEGYKSNGDRFECLARLALLRDEAAHRWPVEAKQAAA